MCAAVIDHFTRMGICSTIETGPEQGPIDDTYTRVRELMLKHINKDTVNCKDTEEGAQEKENEDAQPEERDDEAANSTPQEQEIEPDVGG